MKICATCGENKTTSEFYRRKGVKDGLESACKACRLNRKNKIRRERTGNNGKCKECGAEREYGKAYCKKCKAEAVKYERRNQNSIHQMRNTPGWTPKIKKCDCDTCDLEIGCRAQLRQNLDPLYWNGPETSNEYYHLYEAGIGKNANVR